MQPVRELGAMTLTGLEILRPGRHRENRLRSLVVELSSSVVEELESMNIPDNVLLEAIAKIRGAYVRRLRRKGRTPAIDYWDYLMVETSRELRFEGFAKKIKLDGSITYEALCGLAALLLADSGVAHLDRDESILAAREFLQAAAARDEMLFFRHANELQALAKTAFARAGGKAAHRRTEDVRKQVLKAWDDGMFKGNKSRAGRWVTRNLSVNEAVVRRWIRAYEKDKMGRLR